MTKYCCVPGCKESGGFKFPKDPSQKMAWRVAVRRENIKKGLWKPSNHSVVCSKHFKEEDFVKSDLVRLRRDLVQGAVPSVFNFERKDSKKEEEIQAREERLKIRREKVSNNKTEKTCEASTSTAIQSPLEDCEMFFQLDVSGELNLFRIC